MLLKLIDRFSYPCYYDNKFSDILKKYKNKPINIHLFYNKINTSAIFEGRFKTDVILVLNRAEIKDIKTKCSTIFYKVLCENKVFWVCSVFTENIEL